MFEGSQSGELTFDLITDRRGFEALEPDWCGLLARYQGAAATFLDYNWNWHWASTYLAGDWNELRVVVGRRDGEVAVIAPLACNRAGGIETIGFMGSPVSQYSDLLFDGRDPACGQVIADAIAHIRRRLPADIVAFSNLRDDSPLAGHLAALGVPKVLTSEAPYLDLAGKTEAEVFDQRQSPKHRKNRRRLRRRMEELGTVHMVKVECENARREAIRLAVALKRQSLAADKLNSRVVDDPRFEAFLAVCATSRERPVDCGICELRLDETPIASNFVLRHGGRMSLFATAYDVPMERFSPGALLIEDMLLDAMQSNVETFDFLMPSVPYKRYWADRSVSASNYVLPLSLKGKAYNVVYQRWLRPALVAALEMCPRPLKSFVRTGLRKLRGSG